MANYKNFIYKLSTGVTGSSGNINVSNKTNFLNFYSSLTGSADVLYIVEDIFQNDYIERNYLYTIYGNNGSITNVSASNVFAAEYTYSQSHTESIFAIVEGNNPNVYTYNHHVVPSGSAYEINSFWIETKKYDLLLSQSLLSPEISKSMYI
jgi:hypothetical protein